MNTYEENPFVDVSRKYVSRVQQIPVNAVLQSFPLYLVLDNQQQMTLAEKAINRFKHYPVRREGVNDETAGQVSYLVGQRDGIELGIEMHELYKDGKTLEEKGKTIAVVAVGMAATGVTTGLLFHLRSTKVKAHLLTVLDELSELIEGGDHELIPALLLIANRILELPHRSLMYPFGWTKTEVKIIETYINRLQRTDS